MAADHRNGARLLAGITSGPASSWGIGDVDAAVRDELRAVHGDLRHGARMSTAASPRGFAGAAWVTVLMSAGVGIGHGEATKPRPLAAVAPPVSGRCVRHLRKSVRGVGSQMDVLGRDAELAGIDHWLGMGIAVEGPDPGDPANVLVIEGEPGIGKTTVWGEALRRARLAGWQVLTSSPVPSEAKLPHVGLTDLLRPVPASVLAGIPAPQRRPLEVALLREEAGDGNLEPRAVGTGLMALLDALADAAPLLLAVDDAQWVDPASAGALSFALRRLKRRRVLLLMAVRIEGPSGPGIGAIAALEASLGRQALSRLPVGPLSVASTHQIRQVLGASFPRPALVRIHRAAARQPVLRPGDSARGAARRRPWTRPSATGAGRSSRTCAAAVAEAAPRHQGCPGGSGRDTAALDRRCRP